MGNLPPHHPQNLLLPRFSGYLTEGREPGLGCPYQVQMAAVVRGGSSPIIKIREKTTAHPAQQYPCKQNQDRRIGTPVDGQNTSTDTEPKQSSIGPNQHTITSSSTGLKVLRTLVRIESSGE